MYEISRKHNVPLALLLRANPYVDVFNLQVGDTICIPSGNNQTMSSGSGQTMPSGSSQTMPSGSGQTMPSGSSQTMPSGSGQTMSSGNNQTMPSGSNQTMPSGNNQTVPYPVNTMPQNSGRDNEQKCPMTMNGNNVDRGNSAKTDKDNMNEKTWIKYIVKPGDTLDDILAQMTGSMDEFVERNGLSSIYMLPGIAYYICKEKK